jgi:hypothetical protein
MKIQIEFEDNNYCEHCGERLNLNIDDEITIRDGKVYHTICLPENLTEGDLPPCTLAQKMLDKKMVDTYFSSWRVW